MKIELTAVSLCALLIGCGAEVASTTLTTTKLQATQAEQAKVQAEQIKKNLEDAMRKSEAAASAAAEK